MRIYFDTCCLCRPFDDRNQLRVALEADAVAHLLKLCDDGILQLVASSILDLEVRQTMIPERLAKLEATLEQRQEYLHVTSEVEARAKELASRGYKPFDAAHLAIADCAAVEVFCTCDTKLIRLSDNQSDLKTRVLGPLELIQELDP